MQGFSSAPQVSFFYYALRSKTYFDMCFFRLCILFMTGWQFVSTLNHSYKTTLYHVDLSWYKKSPMLANSSSQSWMLAAAYNSLLLCVLFLYTASSNKNCITNKLRNI